MLTSLDRVILGYEIACICSFCTFINSAFSWKRC